jgi:cysteine synthase B
MNILDTIGNTPLVKIQKLNPNPKVNIFAKLEGFNPTGSIKDRIALYMVERAEKEGILKKGKTIIEPTSGNTGISLAMIGAIKGYKVKIVMPKTMSIERRKMLKFFGAELILVKEKEWRDGAIRFTKSLVKKDKNLVLLNQYENEANVRAHYETTGKEIIEQMGDKKIDVFVAGIGTGGTITGVGRRLKEKYPDIKIVGVFPRPKTKIQGLKSIEEGYIPPILDLKIIDEKIIVKDKEAFEMTKKLAREEGIFVGVSSGAALFAALKIAKRLSSGNIVVIFPDRGEKYLSLLK